MKKLVCFVLISVCMLTMVSAMGDKDSARNRNLQRDVEKVAGAKLSTAEMDIARFTLLFYYYRDRDSPGQGLATVDEAIQQMSKDEYAHAVKQAAVVAKSPLAQGLLRLGAAGEKLLKALIVNIEKGIQAGGQWLDSQSAEYDQSRQGK